MYNFASRMCYSLQTLCWSFKLSHTQTILKLNGANQRNEVERERILVSYTGILKVKD